MRREYLKNNTYIRFPGGECYKINGRIGEGGGSLLYSASKLIFQDEIYREQNNIRYALKECFPYSEEYSFVRNSFGEIQPEGNHKQAADYLHYVASMQLNEGKITSDIYETEAIRMVPILHLASGAEISLDEGQSFHYIANTYTVMTSLENKGESVADWYERGVNYTAAAIFSVIKQVLLALREVHQGEYAHLDIQDGNIFVTGDWREQSLNCFLIDFGSARKLLEDGRCAPVGKEPVFSSQGYRAPEITHILTGEDRNFRLGKEADLYSTGYLLLYLLTGTKYSDDILERFRSKYDKNYLTRSNIQKLNLPVYTEELVQHILARALEPDPMKRYADTEAMIRDVDKVLEALMSSHSRVSGLVYDAYILYQEPHPLHKMAAQTLQKRLEHFRTSGLRRIRRVFLDSTEISADANRDKQTVDALKSSDYLIVVGSADPDDAIWQAKEVKFFLRFHPVSHVLIMVVEQSEKKEEMPSIHVAGLGRNAVLAADARGASVKEIKKKIKKEAALRIAAPILAVPYDGLVQRYRRYRKKKIGSIAAVITITITAVGAHAAYQAYQIQIQHALASQNRALNLCTQALNLYKKGDRNAALETAILPYEEEKTNWSIIPEQVYILNTIMESYASGHGSMFGANGVDDIDNTYAERKLSNKPEPVVLTDDLQAVIECREPEQDTFSQMDFWEEKKLEWTPVVYSLTSGKEVYRLETQTARAESGKGNCVLDLKLKGREKTVWGCWIGQKLWLTDMTDNHTLLGEMSFQSEIAIVKSYKENEFLVGLSNGNVISVTISNDDVIRKLVYKGTGTLYDLDCDSDAQTLELYTSEGVIHCGKRDDTRMTDVDTKGIFGENYKISDVESEDSYVCMWFGNTERQTTVSGYFLEKDAVAVYRSVTEEPVFTYVCEEGWEIKNVQIKEKDGQEYAVLVETGQSDGAVSRIRICKSGEACKTLFSAAGTIEHIQYTSDLDGAYLSGYGFEGHGTDQVLYVDFQNQELSEIALKLEDTEKITDILENRRTTDGDQVLQIISQSEKQIKILAYSVSKKKTVAEQTLNSPDSLKSYHAGIAKTLDDTKLLIYDRSGSVWVLNMNTLEVLYAFNTGEKKYLSMSFFKDGTCLLGADEDSVWLYDLEKEETESVYMTNQLDCSQSKEVRADNFGPYFGFWDTSVYEDTSTDNGISTAALHLFWVDEENQIHAYADVEGGFKLSDSSEIISVYEDDTGFAYGELYEFNELYSRAKEIIKK